MISAKRQYYLLSSYRWVERLRDAESYESAMQDQKGLTMRADCATKTLCQS
jgi:hypothetical protein